MDLKLVCPKCFLSFEIEISKSESHPDKPFTCPQCENKFLIGAALASLVTKSLNCLGIKTKSFDLIGGPEDGCRVILPIDIKKISVPCPMLDETIRISVYERENIEILNLNFIESFYKEKKSA